MTQTAAQTQNQPPAHQMTKGELQEALPAHLKHMASQDLADRVNQYASDPIFAQSLKDNMVSYTNVLKEGRFKVEDYISAVTYVSMKLMGFTNQDAYANTFPQRYQTLVARGADSKEISAYVAAYNKGKLVNLILEQTLVPTWVLNQEIYQKAINTQADLMINSDSDKVRTEAANSILTHLKRPEKQQVEIDVGVRDNSGMEELKDMLGSLAQRQQELIGQGVNTQEIAHQKLGYNRTNDVIDGEVIKEPGEK